MWVADTSDDKLYAYFLETGQRRGRLDFNTLRGIGNNAGVGITSDGTTMWVLDAGDRKVYSYNLLLSDDRTLSALTVSPKDIIGFDAERDSYQLGVDSTVTRATVTATANHPGARVTFTPPDASSGTRGHQVDLSAGRNPVTVTVTAEDGTTQDYTLSINRGVAERLRLERRERPGRAGHDDWTTHPQASPNTTASSGCHPPSFQQSLPTGRTAPASRPRHSPQVRTGTAPICLRTARPSG